LLSRQNARVKAGVESRSERKRARRGRDLFAKQKEL
jgi:hypothetical protein